MQLNVPSSHHTTRSLTHSITLSYMRANLLDRSLALLLTLSLTQTIIPLTSQKKRTHAYGNFQHKYNYK